MKDLEKTQIGKMNVMIIDDDDISNFIYRKVIENAKVSKEIREFQRAREALDYLLEHVDDPSKLPDLLFLDINMPIMSGWDFLEEYAQKIWPNLPKAIILCVLSSSVYKEDIEKASTYEQVNEYVSKPLTHDRIQEISKKYFEDQGCH